MDQKNVKEWKENIDKESSCFVSRFTSNQNLVYLLETLKKEHDTTRLALNDMVSRPYYAHLANFVNELTRVFDVRISKVSFLKNADCCLEGGYNYKDRSLYLKTETNFQELIVTIMHELRHAVQHQRLIYQGRGFTEQIKNALQNYTYIGENMSSIDSLNYTKNDAEQDAVEFSYEMVKKLDDELQIGISQGIDKQQVQHGREVEGAETVLEMTDKFLKIYTAITASAFLEIFNDNYQDKNEKERKIADLLAKARDISVTLSKEYGKILTNTDQIQAEILKTVFDNVTKFQIVEHLDDPLLTSTGLKAMDEHVGKSDKYNYAAKHNLSGYFEGKFSVIQRQWIDNGRKYLKMFGIEFDENSNTDILEKYIQCAPRFCVILTEKSLEQELNDEEKHALFDTELFSWKNVDEQKKYQTVIDIVGAKTLKKRIGDKTAFRIKDGTYIADGFMTKEYLNGYIEKNKKSGNIVGRILNKGEQPKEKD